MTENDSWAFGDWWSLLNKEMAEIGETEALFGDARYTANKLLPIRCIAHHR